MSIKCYLIAHLIHKPVTATIDKIKLQIINKDEPRKKEVLTEDEKLERQVDNGSNYLSIYCLHYFHHFKFMKMVF